MSSLHNIVNSITRFFKRDFRKRFLIIMSFPLLFSSLYLMDAFLLPAHKTTDTIRSVRKITMVKQDAFGVSHRRTVGYKYITEKGSTFSTEKKKKIRDSQIQIAVSPLFDTVKSVKAGSKNIQLQSGLYGIDGVLLMAIFISILISFVYLWLKKTPSENAKLNLIYWNMFLFIVWSIIFIKFVF